MPTARITADRDRLRLLTKVARLYHEKGKRQPEIAAQIHVSQARVSRLLSEAAERGIIRTVVVPPAGVHAELEERLAERFALRDVVVVDVEGNAEDTISALGSGAAAYLDATLIGGDVIGVSSWSATLLAAVEAMRPKRTKVADAVVQLVGGVGSPTVQMEATRLTGRLAEVTGASPVFVPSPGLVGSPALRQALMADPAVRAVLAMWSQVTVSLVGIGGLDPSPLLRRSGNSVAPEEQQELRAAGAVGDVCLRYFNFEGRAIESSFDQRVIGISPADLLSVPRRIGAAGGGEKVDAIRGAVMGGWVNILITDLEVATDLVSR
jgi:DNA-binding transcriptional regulator LsrR (DeoR family)